MKVTKWAVVSPISYANYHPEIENYRRAKHRASEAADLLIRKAQTGGTAALVAHGYFNHLIGPQVREPGFHKSGSHRARYWNAVVYEQD